MADKQVETREGMPLEKRVSLLKMPDAEEASPLGNVLSFLIIIMCAEGFDNALFPNVTKALERTVGFDVGILGPLATVELFSKATFGPFWGVMCARGTLSRVQILTFCSFMQGAATLIMCFLVNYPPAIMFMRAFNGASLAGLTPIAFSIIADRFDDSIRGRMFALMNMSKGLGSTIMGAIYSLTSEWCMSDPVRYDQCPLPISTDCDGPTPEPCSCGGLLGWKLSFICTGIAIMSLAPMVFFFMKVPPVTVMSAPTNEGGGNTCLNEIKGLLGLFRKPTV